MGNIFAGSEIIEIGIQIEKNGRDFYEGVAKKSKKDEAKNLFKLLAGEEEKHVAAFEKLLDSVERYKPQEMQAGEYFEYMNALASEYVFTQKEKGREIAGKIRSEKEAVDLGIGFEKDSIIFYEGMKKVVPEYDVKIISALIEQEKAHLRKLWALKKRIK